MSKRKLKALVKIIMLLLISAAFVSLFFVKCQKEDGYDGNEWFSLQYEYMNKFSSYCNNMDQVYALYIAGDMTESNFIIEYALLENEWQMLESSYKSFLKGHNVRPEGHTYVSKRGEAAINNLRQIVSNILLSSKQGASVLSPDEMLYMYLSYKQDMQYSLAEYVIAYRWIVEAQYTDEQYDEMVSSIVSEFKDEPESK